MFDELFQGVRSISFVQALEVVLMCLHLDVGCGVIDLGRHCDVHEDKEHPSEDCEGTRCV